MGDSMTLYPWLYTQANLLSGQYQAGKLHHALLFNGSEGLGKSGLAQLLAAGILCLNHNDLTHCGQCKSCLLVKGGTHPDLLVLEPTDKAIGIDDVRQINAFIQQHPLIAKRRAIVINQLENMTM